MAEGIASGGKSNNVSASKLQTDCRQQQAASLNCIQDNYDKKTVCQPFFDDYKKCRKEENDRRLEENSKKYFFG
jgi:hypothetical protein